MRSSALLVHALLAVCALGAAPTPVPPERSPSATTDQPGVVLALQSAQPSNPAFSAIERALGEAIAASHTRLEVQNLDLTRFSGPAHDRALARWLAERYREYPVLVVVSLGTTASTFLAQYGRELWPSAAHIYVAVHKDWTAATPRSGRSVVIGTDPQFAATVEAALSLFPDTEEVFLAAGGSRSDQRWLQTAQTALTPLAPRVRLTPLTSMPIDEIERRVAKLPARSLLVPVMFTEDASGQALVTSDVSARLARAANRPTFSVFDTVMGQGIVGGVLTDYQAIGRSTGRAALAALAGAPLDKLSTESADRSELRLDWRQVQRWDVAARLPAAAVIEFREPGLWPRYRWPIIGGAGLAALQVMVIGLLLLERRSRRRLQQSLDDAGQFERAMMAAHAGEVAVIDGSGAVIAANEAWQRGSAAPVGRSAAQASAQRGGPQAALASPAVASALRSVLSSDRAEAVVDVERESSEGRQWSEVRIQRLDRSGGGAVLSCLDISARKRAELQLREHLRGLSHLNMVAAVGEMAASVAHELNQPLTAVLSNAQALRRIIAAGEGDSPLAAEIVEDIIAQDKRAGEIITRIRRLLKKETIDWMPVDVNGLVGDVCHMFGGAGTPGSPSIALELAASLPVVRGDRVQLQQVVLNLVQNAQHAMRDADSLAASRVMVSTGAGDGGVHIAVRDHGAGIAADQIGRVFEPFFSTKHEGLGLGLAISRSIVELHGGNITARNRPEGGAEFLVRLPVEN